MEGTAKKTKSYVLLFVLALLLVIVLAAGIFFLVGSGTSREPSRGTYVMVRCDGVSRS
ncbi:MAG TPA: hypothetical protein PLD49_07870 [Thermoclostridium caenicola]|uniref:hypothetical protein n=1 Tax=Thermoclostridium caenicola TaxID=659425 RepID=UPI002BAA7600|nr:hypothetical protein [Thermoclostridium caenicola]HOK43566.1 hypothetical protein [Thermoclostridium caenicola]HOL84219.1 hypothetical protein [Thermoclostridium caenicola]HPO75778.1 hypothetical protein [Thermoclostridium caenicola]